jgi:hypothetical protein
MHQHNTSQLRTSRASLCPLVPHMDTRWRDRTECGEVEGQRKCSTPLHAEPPSLHMDDHIDHSDHTFAESALSSISMHLTQKQTSARFANPDLNPR